MWVNFYWPNILKKLPENKPSHRFLTFTYKHSTKNLMRYFNSSAFTMSSILKDAAESGASA